MLSRKESSKASVVVAVVEANAGLRVDAGCTGRRVEEENCGSSVTGGLRVGKAVPWGLLGG